MNKRNILLSLVIFLTFIGGFFVGVHYPPKKQTTHYLVTNNPSSTKEITSKKIPEISNKVLIGYVQDYRDPNMVPYNKLTHVIFSFAHPTKDGQLLFNGEIAKENLKTTVEKAHKANTKVMLALGGWYHIQGGESYQYFREAISNIDSRNKLIKRINEIVAEENLDGIDIDFEHPRSLADANHLSDFIKELNITLEKKDKELSIAVSAKVHSVAGTELNNVIYNPEMFKEADYVNIMAYDGQWDGEYNAANLSPYEFNENIINYWTRLFKTHNLSREKLVLGIPSYGQPEDPHIKQVSYSAILNENIENAEKDTVKMNGTVYHYNGTASVQKKTALAMENGFGGMMLWEVGLDAKGNYSLTSIISNKLKENLFAFHS